MKTKTIKIKQGSVEIDYAKVSARIAEMHKAHKDASIKTSFDFKEGWAIIVATFTPDTKKPERVFTGTSMGKVGAIKAFEKLETIAVGRALAFAGFLSDGEIASSEEMANYFDKQTEVNTEEAVKTLTTAKTLPELQQAWLSLTEAERNNPTILNYKDQLKKQYANTPSRPKKSTVAGPAKGQDNRDRAQTDSGVKNS